MSASIELHPAAGRFETVGVGITSRHAFSFGPHYDAANTSFGLLVAHNDELLRPGAGFSEHPHRDLDIVSWVVDGALRHTDELGSRAVVSPGIVQRLAAGSGVRHSETNASPADTRYLQMWLAPTSSGPPEYGTATVTGSGFVVVASGRTADAPLSLRAPATFSVARLAAGERATLEAAAFVHLSVVRGPVALTVDKAPTGDTETVSVSDGDTVRITGAAAIFVQAVAGAEVLAWSMDSSLHR